MPKDVYFCIYIIDTQWFHIESTNFSWISKDTQFQEALALQIPGTNKCYFFYFDEHSISLIFFYN